ncbi:hypothetical protein [Methylibium rhizosphaerae]|uniref:hypothetical protein n=1 Tax=Methylibium rhizosphaerae TaxID=2570323 RepID=UPI00112EF377|nr:hypothetical protein [Methylibium rhizosphaerae]
MLDRIRHMTGLNRYTVETPNSQHQQSANKADMSVRPNLPARAASPAAAAATEMAPRQPLAATAGGESPAPAGMASPVAPMTPSPARSDSALRRTQVDSADACTAAQHPLVAAMVQGATGLHDLVEQQFPGVPQVSLSRLPLQEALQALMPGMSPAAPVGLPGAPAVLLAQSLALATGADAVRASAAIGALRQLDPVGDITDAWHLRGEGMPASPSQAQQDAWRAVLDMATTPSGMRVLQTVMGQPVAPAQERDFVLLMKTVSAMADRNVSAIARPAELIAGLGAPATLLDEALACAAARLAGEVQAARPDDWALNAVRNDLFDTGPGSDFAAVQSRLMKMGRWIGRATNDRWGALRNPMKGKSAFRALRYGTQQVDRGPAVARHRKAFDAALRGAASQLRDQLVALAPTARSSGPGQVPVELLRAAVLDHCLATPDRPLDGRMFDAAAVHDVATRLAGMLATAGGRPAGAAQPGLVEHLKQQPQLRTLVGAPLRMEQLEAWLADALKTHAAQPEGWADAAAAGLQRARVEVQGHDTRLQQVDREALRKSLKHIVQNIEGSSRLRLSSGGVLGVGLRHLSAAVSGLVSGFLLRGRVDARKQWGRQAVFEIAMPPYDMEIMVATQRQRATQLGAGAFVGPHLGIARAGANVDVTAYASESAGLKGVTLRLPRIGRPVSELRTEFSRLVDRLLDGTTAAGNPPQDLLKQLLQEFPGLTVNRIGLAGDERKRHGFSVEGVAAVQAAGMRAGVNAGGALEVQRGVIRHYEDDSGSMQVQRHIAGWSLRGAVGARISAGPSVDAGPVNLNSGNTDTTLVGGSADVLVAGSSDRREVVYQDGRLHPISFHETEFQNLDGFLAHVERRRGEWVRARLASPGTERDAGTEHTKLQGFLDEVTRQATPTHTYAFRSTISPSAAERVDAYRSAALLAQRQGAAPSAAHETVAAMHAAVEGEWADPASLQPYSLRSYERVAAQGFKGLNLVAQFGSVHAADANHIDNRLDAA